MKNTIDEMELVYTQKLKKIINEIQKDNTGILEREFQYNYNKMQCLKDNVAWRVLKSNRIFASLIIFVKKIIRKCIKFYIEPIAEQQIEFNNSNVKVMDIIHSQLQNKVNKIELKAYTNIDELIRLDKETKTSFNFVNRYIKELESDLAKIKKELKGLDGIIDEVDFVKIQLQKQQEFIEKLDMAQVKELCMDRSGQISYSQSGEDRIVEYILAMIGKKIDGMSYLDLGANHAKEISNTYSFYKKGARGVLVEANKSLILELKLFRSEDIILNKCLSNTDGDMVEFYVLNGDGVSTGDLDTALDTIKKNTNLHIERTDTIETVSMETICKKYFPFQAPDLINIDVEGIEMELIKGMNLEIWRPIIIIVETIPYKRYLVVGDKNKEIIDFLNSKDYIEYAFTGINSIFIDKRRITK